MLMRSKLFVPGSRPELFEKAVASSADALSFDLEDAVAGNRKDEARAILSSYLTGRPDASKKIIVVRVNGVRTSFFEPDMEAVVCPATQLINLPMVEEASDIQRAAALLDRLETGERRIGILVNIETPKGLRKAAELAAAHPRVKGLQIGWADLLEPFGISRSDQAALTHIRIQVRLAAAEAGIPAYDGAYAVVSDPDGYRQECADARRLGYAGKSCIHPSQIAAANEEFFPTDAEIEHARRLLSAAEAAKAKGLGAFLVDGQMVDEPFLIRARATLALVDLQDSREPDPVT